MQPVLIPFGPFTLYSYGVFVALAFLVGGYVVYRLAAEAGLSRKHLRDYYLYTALAGLVGARLWYIVFRPDDIHSFWQLFALGGGGLALPGGLLAAGSALVWALRRNRDPVWPWLDIAAIGTVVGLAIAKVGSFLNGDGFGAASGLPWAVEFQDTLAPAAVAGEPIHPLQLYAVVLYAGAAWLLWQLYHRRSPKPRPSQVFWTGLLAVSVIQLALEPLHSSLDALTFGTGGLRVIIPTALVLAGLSAVMLFLVPRRSQE